MTWLVPHWIEYLIIAFVVVVALIALGGFGK